ncbi:hypothetical protein SUGI_1038880 [Cryptomeria japonica]|nr:hypothetical protein SUGI_1038880 [Cryptomeria japonica]
MLYDLSIKEEDVQKHLRTAESELEQGRNSNLFDHILVNDDLDTCYDNLKEILGLSNMSFPLGAPNSLPNPSVVDFEFPYDQSASLVNQKVIVYGGIAADGRGAKNNACP